MAVLSEHSGEPRRLRWRVSALPELTWVKLYCEKYSRITLSVLQCLSTEEIFLAPLVRQEAEVVFCTVLLEIKFVEKCYCCAMQLNINTRVTEGKLSS